MQNVPVAPVIVLSVRRIKQGERCAEEMPASPLRKRSPDP